ncbi:hypothetical protein BRC78_08615, partial [Halobacteriales archaeon QH_8_68_33]
MTDYFEVHGRDGAARRGELRLASPVSTPALVTDADASAGDGSAARPEAGVAHAVLADAGSEWVA